MIEQGIDDYGAEFKRTSHDFSFKFLTQDNCVCNICHGTGANFLRENVLDLICIHGKIGNDGVWFSTADLEKAKFY